VSHGRQRSALPAGTGCSNGRRRARTSPDLCPPGATLVRAPPRARRTGARRPPRVPPRRFPRSRARRKRMYAEPCAVTNACSHGCQLSVNIDRGSFNGSHTRNTVGLPAAEEVEPPLPRERLGTAARRSPDLLRPDLRVMRGRTAVPPIVLGDPRVTSRWVTRVGPTPHSLNRHRAESRYFALRPRDDGAKELARR
jgi:hypothetical protein